MNGIEASLMSGFKSNSLAKECRMKTEYFHMIIMYKRLLHYVRAFVAVLLFLSMIGGSYFVSSSAMADTKVAVVNIPFLLENSPRSRLYGEQIQNKYLPIEQKLAKEEEALKSMEEALDKESHTLSNEERLNRSRDFRNRTRKYKREFEDFRDGLNSERQQALNTIKQEVMTAIDKVRDREHIDIVFDDYVFADKKVDLTPKVLEYLETLYQRQVDRSDKPSQTAENPAIDENQSNIPESSTDQESPAKDNLSIQKEVAQ